jgi:hypothetical protein
MTELVNSLRKDSEFKKVALYVRFEFLRLSSSCHQADENKTETVKVHCSACVLNEKDMQINTHVNLAQSETT